MKSNLLVATVMVSSLVACADSAEQSNANLDGVKHTDLTVEALDRQASESAGVSATCGDNVCSAAEQADITSCPSDCVDAYANFATDINAVLQRTDNTVRPVLGNKKTETVSKLVAFANQLGIPTSDVNPAAQGEQFRKAVVNGEVSAYMNVNQGTDTVEEDDLAVARLTWAARVGADPLPVQTLQTVANSARTTYGLPITSGVDVATLAQATNTDDNSDGVVYTVNQSQGYVRQVNGRVVSNAAFKVEVNPATGLVGGLALRNWWPVGAPAATTLKSSIQLQKDIQYAVALNGGSTSDLFIDRCYPSHFQLSTHLVPSITCTVADLPASSGQDGELSSDPMVVTVSVSTAYALDERQPAPTEYPAETLPGEGTQEKTGDTSSLDRSSVAASGASFYAMYSTSETRFKKGADKFYDKFNSVFTDDHFGKSYESAFYQWSSNPYADDVDLAFVTGHGALRRIVGEDGDLWVNHANADGDSIELGLADMEYLLFTGCHAASAIHCEGMSAISRFKDSSIRDSLFSGLHVYGANHSTRYSSSSILKNVAKNASRYLDSGLTVREAWMDAENDGDSYYRNGTCYKADSPDVDCDVSGWTCDRWGVYPSVFYISSKKGETLYNRSSYSADYRYGDADYTIRNTYTYDSSDSRIPIYSPGYDLGE